MIKRTITYTDFNNQEQTKTFYFNLTKAELAELEVSEEGGLSERLTAIIDSNDNAEIVRIFKKIILMAYGEKSEDGQRFIKSPEAALAFSQTEAYSELFVSLATDAEAATAFVNGIIPKNLPDAPKNLPPKTN